MLTFDGGYNEDGHIGHGGIHGVTFNGNNHAYVNGLCLRGISHFHFYQTSYRNFSGTGAGTGILLDEAWDSCWWGGFMNGCGRAGTGLTTATAGLQIWSSTLDNSNQLYFYGFTFESNQGIDVGIYAPTGNPRQCNAISFVGCKWEQSGAVTNYAGVYVPQSITGMLAFEGKGYVAGYSANGSWLKAVTGATCNIAIADSFEFGSKTVTATGGTLGAAVEVSGTGVVRIGGRITGARLAAQVFLDTSAMTNPQPVRWGTVSLESAQKPGFQWKGRSGVISNVQTEAGRVRYTFKLAPNEAGSFRPSDDNLILAVSVHDKTAMTGLVAIRAESAGVAECVLLTGAAGIEAGLGRADDRWHRDDRRETARPGQRGGRPGLSAEPARDGYDIPLRRGVLPDRHRLVGAAPAAASGRPTRPCIAAAFFGDGRLHNQPVSDRGASLADGKGDGGGE